MLEIYLIGKYKDRPGSKAVVCGVSGPLEYNRARITPIEMGLEPNFLGKKERIVYVYSVLLTSQPK